LALPEPALPGRAFIFWALILFGRKTEIIRITPYS
jgi:hypothetical protein